MNKINKTGEKILQYKEEYLKDYPDVMKEAILIALEHLNVTSEVRTMVENVQYSRKHIQDYLLSEKLHLKSNEELREEYLCLKKRLEDLIDLHGIEDVSAEIDIEKEKLIIQKTFLIDDTFVMDYFSVNEDDLVKLMKKGGFVEIFVSLRLSKVLKDIISDCAPGMSFVTLNYSLPYLNKGGGGYSIDLNMSIHIDDFERTDWQGRILGEIKEVNERSETVFFQKFSI